MDRPPPSGPAEAERPRVGYRQLTTLDPERSYRLNTEDVATGRPIAMGVWYPASAGCEHTLPVGAFFELSADDVLSDVRARVMSSHLRDVVVSEVTGTIVELLDAQERLALDEALAAPSRSCADAPRAPAKGLVLAHPGLGGAFGDNYPLFERLAADGWVVAAMLAQQAHGQWMHVDWDPPTSIRDFDVAHALLDRTFEQDAVPLVVLGHSYGAQAALAYASAREVDAVVSIDSTLDVGTQNAPWWMADDERPWMSRGPDIRAKTLLLAAGDRGTAFFDTLSVERAFMLTVAGLSHNDFEALGAVLRPRVMPLPELERQRVALGYRVVLDSIASFLATEQPGDRFPTGAQLRVRRGRRQRERTPMPALEPLEPDCRATADCEPASVAELVALEWLGRGRFDIGLGAVEKALEVQPSSWRLMEVRARLLAAGGDYAGAATQYADEAELLRKPAKRSPFAAALRDRALANQARAETVAADATPRAETRRSEPARSAR